MILLSNKKMISVKVNSRLSFIVLLTYLFFIQILNILGAKYNFTNYRV